MEKKTKVLLTVCGGILLLGVVASVVRWALVGGGNSGGSDWFMGGPTTCNGIAVDLNYKEEKTEKPGLCSALDVKVQDADVRLVPSESDEIEVYHLYHTDVYQFKWELQGDTLAVWDEVNPKYKKPHGGLSFNFWNSPQSVVEVRLPKSLALRSLAVENNYGDVALKDFTADTMQLNLNSGDLSVKDGRSKAIDIRSDYGDVALGYSQLFEADSFAIQLNSGDLQVKNLSAAKVKVKSDYGDVDLQAMEAGSVEVDLNSGDLQATGLRCTADVTLYSDYGEINLDAFACNGLKVQANSGDVDVGGDVTGRIEIDSDYGDVDLRLLQPAAAYDYSCTTDYGKIVIDGQRIKPEESDDNRCTAQQKNGAANQMDIACSSGDIGVTFSAAQ